MFTDQVEAKWVCAQRTFCGAWDPGVPHMAEVFYHKPSTLFSLRDVSFLGAYGGQVSGGAVVVLAALVGRPWIGVPYEVVVPHALSFCTFFTDQVEAKCLEGLHWRLGPYFAEDVLDGEGDF